MSLIYMYLLISKRDLLANHRALQHEMVTMKTNSELSAEIELQRYALGDLEQQRYYLQAECNCLEQSIAKRSVEMQAMENTLRGYQTDIKLVEAKVFFFLWLCLSFYFKWFKWLPFIILYLLLSTSLYLLFYYSFSLIIFPHYSY